MVFSSALFLFCFFPIVMLVCMVIDNRLRNIWLLLASLFFYAWGEPKYIILMLISISMNYILALLIQNTNSLKFKKALLIITVSCNLIMLGYFKYYDFAIGNLNSLFGTEFSLKNIALPIGISFYTFQSMSYVIDVYKKKVDVQKNIIKLGLYVAFFPQLIAGPIVRYVDIEKEINNRVITRDGLYKGIKRFMIGFSKKVLIADQLAPLVQTVFSANGYSMPAAWIGAIAYSLQIFFDFSGYSDMAIGIGRMLGFTFLENFNYPYISKSIKEFWRRWHMSLSSWFRDYVYIPLGGSRCSSFRNYFNLTVVFSLTGLWHGANWNFVAWGLFHVSFLIAERMFLGKILDKIPNAFAHIYSLFIIITGWVFFRADGLRNALAYIKNMFVFSDDSVTRVISVMNKQYWFCIILGIIFSVPIMYRISKWLEKKNLEIIEDIACTVFFLIAIAYLLGKGFSPFLYFRF